MSSTYGDGGLIYSTLLMRRTIKVREKNLKNRIDFISYQRSNNTMKNYDAKIRDNKETLEMSWNLRQLYS